MVAPRALTLVELNYRPLEKFNMQKDYSVTIFSRHRGKTRTFTLNRRFLYLPLVVLIILVATCLLLWQAYSQESEQRQRLERRIALLEQLSNKFVERSERQGGDAPSKTVSEAAIQPPVTVAVAEEKKETSQEPRPTEVQVASTVETVLQSGEPVAKIDDPKVGSLEGDRAGFRFDFKLVNLISEPINGNVAIIASLRPPHQPRFISFPSMQLVDGMPVKLKKSVGFSIRYFKYVTGRFYFPFSYSESFRILVYDLNSELILDTTLPAEEVTVNRQVVEEPAPAVYPADPSVSS